MALQPDLLTLVNIDPFSRPAIGTALFCGAVIGVTSAAAIGMLAALGVLISMGYLLPAIKLSLLVVLILCGVAFLENRLRVLTRGVHQKTDQTSGRSGRGKL